MVTLCAGWNHFSLAAKRWPRVRIDPFGRESRRGVQVPKSLGSVGKDIPNRGMNIIAWCPLAEILLLWLRNQFRSLRVPSYVYNARDTLSGITVSIHVDKRSVLPYIPRQCACFFSCDKFSFLLVCNSPLGVCLLSTFKPLFRSLIFRLGVGEDMPQSPDFTDKLGAGMVCTFGARGYQVRFFAAIFLIDSVNPRQFRVSNFFCRQNAVFR
jgi:hypothetical protein